MLHKKSRATPFDYPQLIDLEEYKVAEQYFVQKYAKHRDVRAIYRFGGLSAPGISDLDFIVVTKRCLNKPIGKEFSLSHFPGKFKDVIYHNPFIIPEDVAVGFHKIFPLGNTDLIYGKGDTLPPYTQGNVYEKLAVIIYLTNNFYPQIFYNILNFRYKVRFALQILNSFVSYLRLCDDLIGYTPDTKHIANAITDIKSRWFFRSRVANINCLNNILHYAHEYAVVISSKIHSFTKRYYTYTNNAFLVGAFKQGLLFVNGESYSGPVYTKIIADYSTNHRKCFNLLPDSFILPLVMASTQRGSFSEFVRQNLFYNSDNFKVHNHHMKDAIIEQATLFNRVLDYHITNHIAVPPLHDYYRMFYSPIYQRYYNPNYYARIRAI
jgi:hypothetical protein